MVRHVTLAALGLVLAGVAPATACAQDGEERERLKDEVLTELDRRLAFRIEALRKELRDLLADVQRETKAERKPSVTWSVPVVPAARGGFLGVHLDATEDGAVRIAGVTPEGPAARAGLREGDLILSFDGQGVDLVEGLVERVRAKKAGETVTVRYRRDGEEGEARVTLGARPGDIATIEPPTVVPVPVPRATPPKASAPGLFIQPRRLETLPLRLRPVGAPGFLGVSAEDADRGARITGVTPDFPAALAGLREGDVIVAVNGGKVANVAGLREQLQKLGAGGKAVVSYLRGEDDHRATCFLAAAPEAADESGQDELPGGGDGVQPKRR